MELRTLRYFVVTAEEGHISRAAERLGMQQPPLSRQIKALERELNVQLFHRKARGVELTGAGTALLEGARRILAQIEHVVETTQRTASGLEGPVRVGAAPTAPFHPFVSQVIRSFRESFPLVTLTLEESLSNDLFLRLHNRQIDLAFYRSAPSDIAGLKLALLLQEPMIMAVPKGHWLAKNSVSDLRSSCLLNRSNDSTSRYDPREIFPEVIASRKLPSAPSATFAPLKAETPIS